MNRILGKEQLAPRIIRIRIDAPRIARRRKAGQFIILRPSEDGERLPLTISHGSAREGWIEVIYQVVGAGTLSLSRLVPGDKVPDLVGPLGKPTRVARFGRCLCVGGGVGTAPLLPIVRALKEADNHVTSILGAKNRESLILEKEIQASSDEFYITTDDGSLGLKGYASDVFVKLTAEGKRYDYAMIVGPAEMMKVTAELAVRQGTRAWVSLNPIMIDGTGMCGGCRVQIHGETKFACVDGPEFEAAGIDWDSFLLRLKSYKEFERRTREKEKCRLVNRP
jgi:ferredoxin/flavodoxin---NADP+ reductase